MATEEKPGSNSGAGSAMAPGTPGANNPSVASAVPAKVTVAKHGGLRGGKTREDNLVPGSAEAAEADRKKDAERKRKERAEASAALAPKPLPGVGVAQSQPGQTPGSPNAGAGAVDRPRVPWTEGIIKPLSDQGIKVGELVYVGKMSKRATEANLPDVLVKEARKDAEELCKQVHGFFTDALPRVAAKWLNKSGLNPENAPELALITAVGTLAYLHFQNSKKMDEAIEKVKEIEKAKAAAKPANTLQSFSAVPGATAGNPS